jgi:hypothetical protein
VAQADSAAAPKAQHKRMDPAQRMERMQEHRAKRLAALKDKLKLNAGQEGAWSTFTAASQPPAGARPPRMDRAEFAKLTTPQRLERMQARQAERSAMFAKRADATKTFYATLTPDQQKTFDTETAHFGGPTRSPRPRWSWRPARCGTGQGLSPSADDAPESASMENKNPQRASAAGFFC